MRILIVTPEYPPRAGGGIGRFYAVLAPALAREGCQVDLLVAAPFSAPFDWYKQDGVTVRCVAPEHIDARVRDLGKFSATARFRRWLAAAWAAHDVASDLGEFDVIEATDFGLGFVPFVLAPALAPVLVQLHGSIGQIALHEPAFPEVALDHALAQLAEATLLPLAGALQSYGSANAAEWSARFDRSIDVIPPPVAVEPGGAVGPREHRALVVGRVQPWKGPDVLCRAFRLLSADVIEQVIWAGGDTNTGTGAMSLTSELSARFPDVWGSRVVPVGMRPFEDIQRMMATARLVIVPSEWDVFNLTAAEAMAGGAVVVCSDGAGAAEVIESGVNGFRFAARSAESLALAITAAASLSDSEAVALGQAARRTVLERMEPAGIARRRLQAFRALAATPACDERAVPDWVARFFQPEPFPDSGPAFLDQLSLRDLSKYLGRRVGTRLLARVRSSAASTR